MTAAALADVVITHSPVESELLRSAIPGIRVHTIPWAVAPRPGKAAFRKRSGCAFIGGFGHQPNIDAARWLAHEIVPRVRAGDPTFTCYLVGSDMPEDIRALEGNGIVAVGHVEDLAEVLEKVRLTVAPLTYGAGLKGKVLESLAAGVPCVCTDVASEGIELPAALRALVSNDAAGLAVAMLRLHSTQREFERCRKAGLELIASQFSSERIDRLMADALGTALPKQTQVQAASEPAPVKATRRRKKKLT
jgi:glycosyltransferase involved in cell wall biosynthesis